MILIPASTINAPIPRLNNFDWYNATPLPMANSGPINGERSIAPMTVAVEFKFKPMQAIKIAQTRMIKFSQVSWLSLLIWLINSDGK